MEETTVNRKSPIIIGIAGGTGSGKSTFTNRLKDAFGDQVTVLYHDNYYRAHDDMPFEQRKKLNYDHPDAFETELLLEHLNKLKKLGSNLQLRQPQPRRSNHSHRAAPGYPVGGHSRSL